MVVELFNRCSVAIKTLLYGTDDFVGIYMEESQDTRGMKLLVDPLPKRDHQGWAIETRQNSRVL